jgi:hypothetical protein
VSIGWTLAVDREALHFLLAANSRNRTRLLDGLDQLVREPHQPCDFIRRSPNQRDYSVKMIGRFVVTYWLEPEKVVRVVKIERISSS